MYSYEKYVNLTNRLGVCEINLDNECLVNCVKHIEFFDIKDISQTYPLSKQKLIRLLAPHLMRALLWKNNTFYGYGQNLSIRVHRRGQIHKMFKGFKIFKTFILEPLLD